MMENAGVSVETGASDQLDQAFQLDFESNAELEAFEAEGLDFGFDGRYEEVEGVSTEEIPVDSYAGLDHILTGHLPDDATVEPEFEHAAPEAHSTAIDDKMIRKTEPTNDADDDAKADVEYQDEIGYEDDEFLATEANTELSNTEADETEAALAGTLSENNPVPAPVTDNGGYLEEESLHGNDVSWDQGIDFQVHDESTGAQEPQAHALDDADAEEIARQEEGNGLIIDAFDNETTREQPAITDRGFDLEKVLDDIANPHIEIPDIEVLYNQECYSLFGTSDDDPDSYFLSEVEEVDRPLSHFLSALRAVISDEITATDELVIRFDPLELEFGERSNETFLNRSFREILDCHSTLGQAPGVPADPVLHLTVRRDSEEHFLEILANVAQVNESPSSAEDSEISENDEQGSRTNDVDYERAEDETFEDGNLDEYHDEDGHAGADHEEENELESALSHDGAPGEQEQDNQLDVAAPQPSDAAGVPFEGEVQFKIPSAEGLSHDATDDRAHEEQAWGEQATGDDNGVVSQPPKTPIEETDEVDHQPTEQQGDEVPETSGFGAVDSAVAPNDGVSEQEADSNDDDLILAFDDEPIHEGTDEHGEDAITYDDVEDPNNDAEDVQEPLAAETFDQSVVEHSEHGGQGTTEAETASVHTSTTMGGDEIDYDEDDTADRTFTDAPQLAAASGENKDEIDWENDEDEYDQQPAVENAGAGSEEPKAVPLTPPSVAGKRTRADETESLADETDYKRRRT